MEFINIWPAYIKGGCERHAVGWVVAKAEADQLTLASGGSEHA